MVWAAIAHGYRSPLVVIDDNLNAQRYRDDILAHREFLCSTTTPTSRFFSMIMSPLIQLQRLYIFLGNSPDLNPIEHVWDSLDRRLRCRPNPPANVNELRQALIQEWNNSPQSEINTLVNSMRW